MKMNIDRLFQNRIGIDWLNFSRPRVEQIEVNRILYELTDIFGSGSDKEMHGAHGYRGYSLGVAGMYLWRDNQKNHDLRDVRIEFPATALDHIKAESMGTGEGGGLNEFDILQIVKSYGFHCTRIDIAMDVLDEDINPYLAYRHWEAGQVSCRANRAKWEQSNIGRGGEIGGHGESATLYIGSPNSSRRMRIYDKKAEMAYKRGILIPHLTRFELEIKKKKSDRNGRRHNAADAAAEMILNTPNDHHRMAVMGKIIRGWITFQRLGSTDRKKERRPTAEWWDRLFRSRGKMTLGLERGLATPDRSIKYIAENLAATLRLIREYGQGGVIERAIEEARPSMEKCMIWEHWEKMNGKERLLKPEKQKSGING